MYLCTYVVQFITFINTTEVIRIFHSVDEALKRKLLNNSS